MAETQTKAIPEFMLTEKGKHSKFRFSAILGIKFNHKNSRGHTLLVQVQNINTKFTNLIEIAPDLIRYKYKLGKVYQKGKLVKDGELKTNKLSFEIDTSDLIQIPLYQQLSKTNISFILGDKEFNSFAFGKNFCYIYETDEAEIVIPSSAVLLYYYLRSSSMKNAVLKGDYNFMYDKDESNLHNKSDAHIVLKQGYSLLDGPFIYRFVTDRYASKGFIDIFSYISAIKSKNEINNKTTDVIPIKALFPTKEKFVIKIRYIELPELSKNGKKIFYAQEIFNDESSLDFEKLTVSKVKRKKQDEAEDEEGNTLVVKGKKPKDNSGKISNKTPSKTYSTRYLQENEEEKNLALQDKIVQYSAIEIIDTTAIKELSEPSDETVDISFVKSENDGDKNTQGASFESNPNEKLKHSKKEPNFEIFKACIEYLENTGLVSDFIFEEIYEGIPYEKMKNGELYSRCAIDGELKQYTTCSFVYNDLNVVLVEVESENADFATWVLNSVNMISTNKILQMLTLRYKNNTRISDLKDTYNNVNNIRFEIKKHPIVDEDGYIDEAMLESWTLTLLSKLK